MSLSPDIQTLHVYALKPSHAAMQGGARETHACVRATRPDGKNEAWPRGNAFLYYIVFSVRAAYIYK